MDAPHQPDLQSGSGPPDYVMRNRAAWDSYAPGSKEPGRKCWQSSQPLWGIWSILFPQATLDWARRWPCEEVWVARK